MYLFAETHPCPDWVASPSPDSVPLPRLLWPPYPPPTPIPPPRSLPSSSLVVEPPQADEVALAFWLPRLEVILGGSEHLQAFMCHCECLSDAEILYRACQ